MERDDGAVCLQSGGQRRRARVAKVVTIEHECHEFAVALLQRFGQGQRSLLANVLPSEIELAAVGQVVQGKIAAAFLHILILAPVAARNGHECQGAEREMAAHHFKCAADAAERSLARRHARRQI